LTDSSTAGTTRTYRLVSATYRDKSYEDGVFVLYEARGEIELRQLVGRKKNDQAPIARFRFEPTTEVKVDGPLLKVSDLSITLESPAVAGEIAQLLRRPAREREASLAVTESESAVREFLESREKAMAFLAKLKTKPREALLSAEALWASDDPNGPLEAVYSSYSSHLAVSLEKMTSSLKDAERGLGRRATGRLYAVAFTIKAVQDSLLDGDPDMAHELAALQELGISVTLQELRRESLVDWLMQRAHPAIVGLAAPGA